MYLNDLGWLPEYGSLETPRELPANGLLAEMAARQELTFTARDLRWLNYVARDPRAELTAMRHAGLSGEVPIIHITAARQELLWWLGISDWTWDLNTETVLKLGEYLGEEINPDAIAFCSVAIRYLAELKPEHFTSYLFRAARDRLVEAPWSAVWYANVVSGNEMSATDRPIKLKRWQRRVALALVDQVAQESILAAMSTDPTPWKHLAYRTHPHEYARYFPRAAACFGRLKEIA